VRKSAIAFAAARQFPHLVQFGLKIASFRFPRGDEHWTFPELCAAADCRVTVRGRLGNGMEMQLVWMDVVSREIRENGWFEPETVSFVNKLLGPGKRFFDVGAQLGQYTLLAAGLKAEVHSFEPDPKTFKLLSKNVARNRLSVTLNRCAITNHDGTVSFYPSAVDNIGMGSCTPAQNATGKCVTVESVTLDSYAQKHGTPHLIKLDVEGSEIAALQGANELMKAGVPLIVEFAPLCRDCGALADFLRSHGYRIHRITAEGVIPYRQVDGEKKFFNVFADAEN
jgi:FkbM family methyltransferase